MNRKSVKSKYIVGVDEAGRGPLAGPVSVAVIVFKSDFYKSYKRRKDSLPFGFDSKKLNRKKREAWYLKIQEMKKMRQCDFRQTFSSSKTIDEKGIVYAVSSGIKRCLKRLNIEEESSLLLDGSLKAPKRYQRQKTIIRGDEKEKIIALASIIAKVKRDRKMERLSKIFPEYMFEIHKGYGTAEHYKKIKKHGLSAIHRKSFLRSLTQYQD